MNEIGKRHFGETGNEFGRDDVGHIGILTALSELKGEGKVGKETDDLGGRLPTGGTNE